MNCNLLIVDDSPVLRMAITKVARVAGVDDNHLFDAGNGAEALKVLETVWIDLVLLDLNMPVMNGEQFMEEKIRRPALEDVAVVIVSTESNKDRLEKMVALGASASLHKPFEPEDLCRLINTVLGGTT